VHWDGDGDIGLNGPRIWFGAAVVRSFFTAFS